MDHNDVASTSIRCLFMPWEASLVHDILLSEGGFTYLVQRVENRNRSHDFADSTKS